MSLGGAGTGAAAGALYGSLVPGIGTVVGGLGGGLIGGLFGGGKSKGGTNIMDIISGLIDKYSYKPEYTGQTEKSLFDLFQRMTGQSGLGVDGLPFDIGLPTTGLYDSLARGIKQDYLGTPGGPQGGQIADSQAYFNNLGIPEQAANQTRLGYQDMNNSLLDKAALINESQKDRLTNILNMGNTSGQNLYSQNLAQHRFNTGLASNAMSMDYGLSNAISEGNNSALDSLFGSTGTSSGTGTSLLTSLLGSLTGGNKPQQIGYSTDPTKNPYNQYTGAKNATAKLI